MLNLFEKRKRKPESGELPDGVAGFRRDPFAAVPLRNPLAEGREDRDGCLQLRMRIPPKPGLGARLAGRLGYHRDLRVNLDERGSFFWSLVDGRRDLAGIEQALRERFSLEREESNKATLLFTRMLMMRHLVLLDVRDDGEGENHHG